MITLEELKELVMDAHMSGYLTSMCAVFDMDTNAEMYFNQNIRKMKDALERIQTREISQKLGEIMQISLAELKELILDAHEHGQLISGTYDLKDNADAYFQEKLPYMFGHEITRVSKNEVKIKYTKKYLDYDLLLDELKSMIS